AEPRRAAAGSISTRLQLPRESRRGYCLADGPVDPTCAAFRCLPGIASPVPAARLLRRHRSVGHCLSRQLPALVRTGPFRHAAPARHRPARRSRTRRGHLRGCRAVDPLPGAGAARRYRHDCDPYHGTRRRQRPSAPTRAARAGRAGRGVRSGGVHLACRTTAAPAFRLARRRRANPLCERRRMSLIVSVASSTIAAPTRLDPLELFLDADIVVQLVIVGLVLASIWVWTIIVSFSMRMGKLRRRSSAFEQDFWESDQP